MKTPDITPAQILAILIAVLGQAVALGFVSDATAQAISQGASIFVPAVLFIADAVIRHGRAHVAAAQVHAEAYDTFATSDPPTATAVGPITDKEVASGSTA